MIVQFKFGAYIGKYFNYVIDTGVGSDSVAPFLDYMGADKKSIIVVNTHCHYDYLG